MMDWSASVLSQATIEVMDDGRSVTVLTLELIGTVVVSKEKSSTRTEILLFNPRNRSDNKDFRQRTSRSKMLSVSNPDSSDVESTLAYKRASAASVAVISEKLSTSDAISADPSMVAETDDVDAMFAEMGDMVVPLCSVPASRPVDAIEAEIEPVP